MVTDLASALTNLGSVDNNGLYTLIQQLLTVTSQLQTAQSQIQSLIASSGANSILASLTNTGTIVTALNSITTQLFLAINCTYPSCHLPRFEPVLTLASPFVFHSCLYQPRRHP